MGALHPRAGFPALPLAGIRAFPRRGSRRAHAIAADIDAGIMLGLNTLQAVTDPAR